MTKIVTNPSRCVKICSINIQYDWDLPGCPVVKTSPSNAGGAGSIPGRGAKIPHALWPKNQKNIKQKQYCNKFNKGFKNGLHQKVFKTKCSMVNALALCNSESVSAKKMDENRF